MKLRAVLSILRLASPSVARLRIHETSTVPPPDVDLPLLNIEEGIDTDAASSVEAGASHVVPEGAYALAGNDDPEDEVSGNGDFFAEAEAEVAAAGEFDWMQAFRICSGGRCIAPTACSGEYPELTTKPKKGGGDWQWWKWDNEGRIKNWSQSCDQLYITYQEGWDLYLQEWTEENMNDDEPVIQIWQHTADNAVWTKMSPTENKLKLKLSWSVYNRQVGKRISLSGKPGDHSFFTLSNKEDL